MRHICFFLLALLVPSMSYADSRIEEIIDALDIKSSYERSIEDSFLLADPPINVQNDGSLPSQIILEMNERSDALKEEYLGWLSIKPVLIEAYRESFTEKELREYVELLKNPTFRSILKKEEVVSDRVGSLIQERVSEYSEKNAENVQMSYEKLERYIREKKQSEK